MTVPSRHRQLQAVVRRRTCNARPRHGAPARLRFGFSAGWVSDWSLALGRICSYLSALGLGQAIAGQRLCFRLPFFNSSGGSAGSLWILGLSAPAFFSGPGQAAAGLWPCIFHYFLFRRECRIPVVSRALSPSLLLRSGRSLRRDSAGTGDVRDAAGRDRRDMEYQEVAASAGWKHPDARG